MRALPCCFAMLLLAACPTQSGSDDAGPSDAGLSAPDVGAPTMDAALVDPPPAPGACAGHWCWETPVPQGNTLTVGTAFDSQNVWLGGLGGTLLQWDGTAWKAHSTPADEFRVVSLWGNGPSDLWVVGNKLHRRDVIAHWDGRSWTKSWEGEGADLRALHGSSSTDIWAVGADLILHWDGTTWTSVPFEPLEGGDTGFLNAVFARGPDDVWFAGNANAQPPFARHWDGKTVSTVTVPCYGGANGFWASGASDLILWGDLYCGPDGATRAPLVRWDGMSWLPLEQQPPSGVLALSGTDSTDLYVASAGAGLYHFDGVAWTRSALPEEFKRVETTGVTSVFSNDVWVSGSHGALAHWDGQAWSLASSGAGDVLAVWGAAPDDVWAGAGGELRHWDGTGWTTKETFTGAIGQLSGTASDDVWALRTIWSGRWLSSLLHWDGSAWTERTGGPDGTIIAIRALPAGKALATNTPWTTPGPCTLWEFDGQWRQLAHVSDFCRGNSAIARVGTTLYVLGANAPNTAVLRRSVDGGDWMPVSTGCSGSIGAIYGAGQDLWLMGSGAPRRFDGTTCHTVPSDLLPTDYLSAMTGNESDGLWAVGMGHEHLTEDSAGAIVARWDGSRWTVVSRNRFEPPTGIWFGGGRGWLAVGTGLLRYQP